jgi:hypothetical protein
MPDRIIDRIMPGEAVVPEQQISHLPAVTKLKLRPTSNILSRPECECRVFTVHVRHSPSTPHPSS